MKGGEALQMLDTDASMHLSSDASALAAGKAGVGGGWGEERDEVGSRIGSDVFRIYQVVPAPHTTWCAAHGDACTGTHVRVRVRVGVGDLADMTRPVVCSTCVRRDPRHLVRIPLACLPACLPVLSSCPAEAPTSSYLNVSQVFDNTHVRLL
jgi:hypothetical protein